jgi:hypothetical protein
MDNKTDKALENPENEDSKTTGSKGIYETETQRMLGVRKLHT